VGALAEVLRTIDAEYGDVVVDCPNGLRADAGVPLAVADACVLVASPRGFALADAVRTRELARELDAGVAAVALNRTVDDPPVEAVRRLLGAPVVAVPEDDLLARSLAEGSPAVRSSRGPPAVRRLRELADAVRRCR
jgi:septum site-determining protein MinD